MLIGVHLTEKKCTARLCRFKYRTKQFRSSESLKLLNWAYRNTNTYEISKKEETFFELDTWLAKKNKVKVTTKDDYYITLNKKDVRHLKVSLEYDGPLKAPIKKDTEVAKLIITTKNDVVKTLPLYASESIEKVNFLKSLVTSLNYLIWGDV